MWLELKGKLAVKDRIFKWNPSLNSICSLCGHCTENIDYLFFVCSFSCQVWRKVLHNCNINRELFTWLREVSYFTKKVAGKSILARTRRTALLASVYHVWMERNQATFQISTPCVNRVVNNIRDAIIDRVICNTKNINPNIIANWGRV